MIKTIISIVSISLITAFAPAASATPKVTDRHMRHLIIWLTALDFSREPVQPGDPPEKTEAKIEAAKFAQLRIKFCLENTKAVDLDVHCPLHLEAGAMYWDEVRDGKR